MHIQVPWKMRLNKGDQISPRSVNWWMRKKFHGDSGMTERPADREEDLDHLGRRHMKKR